APETCASWVTNTTSTVAMAAPPPGSLVRPTMYGLPYPAALRSARSVYDRRVRVLAITTPSRSSVHPVLPLCRALRDAGHDVLVAIAPNYTDVIRRAGLDAVGAGPEWDHVNADRFIPGWTRMPSHAYMAAMAGIAGRGIVEDTLPVAESWGPDVV